MSLTSRFPLHEVFFFAFDTLLIFRASAGGPAKGGGGGGVEEDDIQHSLAGA
jgi:hypothetical protein